MSKVLLFTTGDRVVRSETAISAEVDGEVVALDAARGVCYGLNSTGSRIWQLMETSISVTDICLTLASEFDVDLGTCESEVLDLLASMNAEGLISVVSGASVATSSP